VPRLASAHGLEDAAAARSLTLPTAFGERLAAEEELLLTDARLQPETAVGPLPGELGLVAWAGVPLPATRLAGALYAADRRPREWTERDLELLRDLAGMAAAELESERLAAERDEARGEVLDSEEQLRTTFDAIELGMLMVSLDPP